jgi:hypothetical protein
MNRNRKTTTIGLTKKTKGRLSVLKAPGQSYNGFIGELVGLWEDTRTKTKEIVRRPR